MKKSVLLLLGIIIGAAASYFYFNGQDKTEEVAEIIIPEGVITIEEGKALSNAYSPRYRLLTDSLVRRTKGDNRSSGYSVTDVRNYLDYAESEYTAAGYTLDSIRIYLGAYSPKDGVPGYTTMFIAPVMPEGLSKGSMNLFNTNSLLKRQIPPPPLNAGDPGDPPSKGY